MRTWNIVLIGHNNMGISSRVISRDLRTTFVIFVGLFRAKCLVFSARLTRIYSSYQSKRLSHILGQTSTSRFLEPERKRTFPNSVLSFTCNSPTNRTSQKVTPIYLTHHVQKCLILFDVSAMSK